MATKKLTTATRQSTAANTAQKQSGTGGVSMSSIEARRKKAESGSDTQLKKLDLGGVSEESIEARRKKLESSKAETTNAAQGTANAQTTTNGKKRVDLAGGAAHQRQSTASSTLADAFSSYAGTANKDKQTQTSTNKHGGSGGSVKLNLAQQYAQSFGKNAEADDFDKINQWLDTGDNRNLAQAVRRVDGSNGTYTDNDLIKQGGWTQSQIDEARQMNAAQDAIPVTQRALRRASNAIGGTADSIAAGVVTAAETAAQEVKNRKDVASGIKALEAEVKGNDRQQQLYTLLQADGDVAGSGALDKLIKAKGYTQDEIDDMRGRISEAKAAANRGVDEKTSLGYQMQKRAQSLTGAAQSGLSDAGKFALSAATSAGENLAVAGINPAAVLPVLSAQGAGEAMTESMDKDESALKTLVGGTAKFGAGWAINSVGVADLAKTMGSDYAKDTLAGKLADAVRAVAGSSKLAQKYPAIANAISGGIDNAAQAFVETYADKAIDAVLGDSEAAESMLTQETFLSALEAGLSGGVSGAMGGAIGTGLAKYNDGNASLLGQSEYYAALDEAQRAEALQKALQRVSEPTQNEAEDVSGAADQRTGEAQAAQLAALAEAAQAEQAAQAASGGDTESSDADIMRDIIESTLGSTAEAQTRSAAQAADTADSVEAIAQEVRAAQAAADASARNTSDTDAIAALDDMEIAQLAAANSEAADGEQLRNTIGLREAPTTQQSQDRVENTLRSWQVSEKGAQEIAKFLPAGLDSDVYAAAASSIYRLGQMQDVDSFSKALQLAGTENSLGLNVAQVLARPTGRTALEAAYTFGRGEVEARNQRMAGLGGTLSAKSTSGEGVTYYNGTLRSMDEAASRIISLNAQGTGTDAVLKNVLTDASGKTNTAVRAYVDTETARIFFGDSAQDVFSTVLHEDYHWYNALDTEGAKTLQDHALEYLASANGYENIDELIKAKIGNYAQQQLTYEQAAEELVADAWRGIFDSEESFTRWAQFQTEQAQKNASKRSGITKVMRQVKAMLDNVISKAKEILGFEPDNAAAKKAQRLAESEKRILQDEYFAHAEKAMDNLRAMKTENKNAADSESRAAKSNDVLKKSARFEADESFGQTEKIDFAKAKTEKQRYQLAEDADRQARSDTQRQASRAIAEREAALNTLMDFFGMTRGVKVSQDSLQGMALRLIEAAGAHGKMQSAQFANELRPLVEYVKADGADMSKAQSMAEVLAGEILDHATYRNDELWRAHPELHTLEYTVAKGGQAEAELIKRYGKWDNATAEAKKHGVQLRREAGHRDTSPADLYERATGGFEASATGKPDGETAALFRSAAENAGVAGAMSLESTEWLDVLMNVHDAIKPQMQSVYADTAEYEDAKVDLAGRMLGEIMNLNEMKDAQAIFEGIQEHNRQVAAAAAGDDARAAEVLKGLDSVQREQRRAFNRKLAQNSRAAAKSENAQAMQQAERSNAAAEKQLDKTLDTFGVDVANIGDLNEKLTVLRETYEREWKAEQKRMRNERQQMMDDITLERQKLKAENSALQSMAKNERRRADRAEYRLIVQENEIMEWEEENQRKAAAWQEKQAQRNAIAIETAQQQRDEEIAIAKRLAEKRVEKARDARKMDELRRSIRKNAATLNQMLLRPSEGKYVQERLVAQAAEVAKLADTAVLNAHTVNKLDALARSVAKMEGHEVGAQSEGDWTRSGIDKLIETLKEDLDNTKQAKLDKLTQQLAEAESLPDSEKAAALRDRLKSRIRQTEARTYMPLTVDQMRTLNAIVSSTVHLIRTENKTLSLAKAKEIGKMTEAAAREVTQSKGKGEKFWQQKLTAYNLDMLGGQRVFRMLGGYRTGGQMEALGNMLNAGQLRQTEITINGEKLFENVTGKANAQKMREFAGDEAKTVELNFPKRSVELTHAQLCSLWMHLQNKDSIQHLMTGGVVVPDMELYHKGDIAEAYQRGTVLNLGAMADGEGKLVADSIIQVVDSAMDDYDRAWCADMKEFFGKYTTDLINETSMKLVGFKRAQVKNYYPISVDKTRLATQIEGLHLDATIEGRGFLKNRVKSSQPILLEECQNVVQRSLRDTAAYAGLAAPIRDVQKVLNGRVNMDDGDTNLKNGVIAQEWGNEAVGYINDLLTDLQTTQRTRKSALGKTLTKLRGNYAGAVLTLNPSVAIAQAASLPTAAAVLGNDTMASVMPFVKNFDAKQRAAVEKEISEHGDVLLQWRMRGAQEGELQSIGARKNSAEKLMDKLPKSVTGWINTVDEITVAALWEGCKEYVNNHTYEFQDIGAGMTMDEALQQIDTEALDKRMAENDDAAEVYERAARELIEAKAEGWTLEIGSDDYWKAVNRMYQKVIEQTQPNYTTMQRAGIQRNPNELVKTLTMFTTQRFQNYGILADAIMDYNANKDSNLEGDRVKQNLKRAVSSQVIQTAVFAGAKMAMDFILHRFDREQDENGDVTAWSMLARFASLFSESAAGNLLYGSEMYSAVSNVVTGSDYDVVDASNLSVINDTVSGVTTLWSKFKKLGEAYKTDTSGMTETELDEYHESLMSAWQAFAVAAAEIGEEAAEAQGLPIGNAKKLATAGVSWMSDVIKAAKGEGFTFSSVPDSATGQYDRLFNAALNGDTKTAQAALKKLEQMGKDEKTINSQLKTRLKSYDERISDAAAAQVKGNDDKRRKLTQETVLSLYDALGIDRKSKADAEKRTAVIDMVTGAINDVADKQLKGDRETIYDDLADALDSGKASGVQKELDRLMTAGKEASKLKTKITALVKEEYIAGNDTDRQRIEKMLLTLKDGEGNALYEEKTFTQWVKNAEKAAASEEADEWASLR